MVKYKKKKGRKRAKERKATTIERNASELHTEKDPNLRSLNISGNDLKKKKKKKNLRSFPSRVVEKERREKCLLARKVAHRPLALVGIAGAEEGIFTLRFSHLIHIKVARKQEGSIVTSTMIGHSRAHFLSPSLSLSLSLRFPLFPPIYSVVSRALRVDFIAS